MKKTISIENHSVEVNTSMGWVFVYREQFGHDILPDILPLLDAIVEILVDVYDEEGTLADKLRDGLADRITITLAALEFTTLINTFWAMAKNADDSIAEPKTWVNQFDVFPMDTVAVELFQLLLSSSISSKNSASLLNKISDLRSNSTSLSSLQRQES